MNTKPKIIRDKDFNAYYRRKHIVNDLGSKHSKVTKIYTHVFLTKLTRLQNSWSSLYPYLTWYTDKEQGQVYTISISIQPVQENFHIHIQKKISTYTYKKKKKAAAPYRNSLDVKQNKKKSKIY